MKKWVTLFFFCATASLFAQDAWTSFKNETILEMSAIPGWCTREKALLIMDLVKEEKCQSCIEIGVFSGMSLFPIAKALQYNKSGKVYGIDAWDNFEAVKGFSRADPGHAWWSGLDLDYFYKQTLALVQKNGLDDFCCLIKQSSQESVKAFTDESIDFLHLDGNHNEEFAFQDVINYFPKIKDGGYILLNDPNWLSMKRSLVFLLEKTDVISVFSPTATFLLFRKNNHRAQSASVLFED